VLAGDLEQISHFADRCGATPYPTEGGTVMRLLYRFVPTGTGIKILAVVAAVVAMATLAGVCAAVPLHTWYFDESGTLGWGQNGWANPPQWEWMDAGPLSNPLPYYDLDPANPYYACSGAHSADYSGLYFWADIWFANNYISANTITVELRKGGWYNQGSLVASAVQVVTNQLPGGVKYTFAFGVIPTLVLNNESLVVKIIYSGQSGDGHIYWDLTAYPSALHADAPVPTDYSTWGKVKALYNESR
jgi:hypothetical protein